MSNRSTPIAVHSGIDGELALSFVAVTPPSQYTEPDEYDEVYDGEDEEAPHNNQPVPGVHVTDLRSSGLHVHDASLPGVHEADLLGDDEQQVLMEDVLYQQGATLTVSLGESSNNDKPKELVDNTVTSYVIAAPHARAYSPPPSAGNITTAPAASTGSTTPAPPATPPAPKVQFVPVVDVERLVGAGPGAARADDAEPTPDTCPLDCGPGGACVTETLEAEDGSYHHPQRCQCPLGRGGSACQDGEYPCAFHCGARNQYFWEGDQCRSM